MMRTGQGFGYVRSADVADLFTTNFHMKTRELDYKTTG